MADNDIQTISGELLPATANLVEVTRSLQAQNAAMMMGGGGSSDDPTVEIRSIFMSMDKTLTRISNDIKDFTKNISKMFDSINQNHIQSITIQQESLENEEEQLLLNREQAENEEQKKKKENLQGAEAKREGSKGFTSNFLKDVGDAQKELEEKGFLKYVADLMGVGGVISGVMTTVARIVPLMIAVFKGIGTFVTKTLLPAIIKIGKNLLRVFGRILLPLYAIYNGVMGFVEGFTANEDDNLAEKFLRGISRGIEQVISAIVMWPADLIKDMVSWLAGALGFTEIESFLDSFSFQEGFAELMDTFETWITGIPDRITAWFNETIDAISTWFDETLTSIGDFFSPLTEAWNQVSEKISGIGDEISTFFSELFDFSKIKSMLTNMFAEIGVPRIEFDVPVIGKVGFGPFYPFMPDTNVANVESSDSFETVSTQSSDGSIDTRERTSQEGITVVEGAMTGKYARGAQSSFVTKETIDATSGEEITKIRQKKVSGGFDTETGEGTIVYQTRDADNELNNIMQEYKVTGVTFGQVRRLVDDGASPDEVRMFLENKQKSIFDKIGDFFSSPAETAPIQVAPAETKRTDIAQELGTQTIAREEARAEQQSQQAVNVVNAPTSNVSNISQSSAYFDTPSAVDGLSMSY